MLKDIVIGYLKDKLSKEDVIHKLLQNKIPIDAYNSVLLNLIRKIKKKRSRLAVRRKNLATKNLVDKTTLNNILQNTSLGYSQQEKCEEFNKMLVITPSLFLENRRMLIESEIQDKLKVFADHFKIQSKVDKKFFWVIERGCKEFIKKELEKMNKK